MSHEDIEVAKAKRAAKQAATNGNSAKRKHGRRCKTVVPERVKAKKAQRSEAGVAEDEIVAGGAT